MSLTLYRRIVSLATLAMIALSWTLWAPVDDFPRVPFVSEFGKLPSHLVWGIFGLLILSLIFAASSLAWKQAMVVAVLALSILVLQDQHRFQPWAYQFMVTGLVLLLVGEKLGSSLVRLYFISLYLHSGLSKLDVSFCRELGGSFLNQLGSPFGLRPWEWPERSRYAAGFVLPAYEIAIAVGLVFKRTRTGAASAAVLMHMLLIWMLGPWGLKHTAVVLVWNLALAAEVGVVFWGSKSGTSANIADAPGPTHSRLGPYVAGLFFLVVFCLPFGERAGVFDSWPAFAFYASHSERTNVMVHDDDLAAYPTRIKRHFSRVGSSSWQRIDLLEWSRSVRGTPIYPQNRACLGLAEALAKHYSGKHQIWVEQLGRASIVSGDRTREEIFGLDAIRQRADKYRLNARSIDWNPKE